MFEFDHTKYFGGCPGGMFPPDRKFTPAEELEHTKKELHDMCDRLRKFEETMKAEMENTLSMITNDNTIFKNTFVESFKLFGEEVRAEINKFETNVDNTITLFMRTTESRLNDLENRLSAVEGA